MEGQAAVQVLSHKMSGSAQRCGYEDCSSGWQMELGAGSWSVVSAPDVAVELQPLNRYSHALAVAIYLINLAPKWQADCRRAIMHKIVHIGDDQVNNAPRLASGHDIVKVEKLPRLADAPANDEPSNSGGDELQQQQSSASAPWFAVDGRSASLLEACLLCKHPFASPPP